MKRLFLLVLMLIFLFLFACETPKPKDPLAYANNSFYLSVRGELCLDADPVLVEGTVGKTRAGTPLPFSAEVSSAPIPAGKVADGLPPGEKAYEVSITYTSPDALAGLSLTCLYGGRETASTATLTRPSPTGEITVSLPYEAVSGLLIPILTLLPQGDVCEISPVKDGARTVTCKDADGKTIIYHFAEDSPYPIKAEAQKEGLHILVYTHPIT